MALKAIKRKAQQSITYRDALIALAEISKNLGVLKVANGDTILFKLGEHSKLTNDMIRAFLAVGEHRGLKDVHAFLLKPGETVERISDAAFEAWALLKGFKREVDYAGSVESATEGDGDRGAPPGEVAGEEPRSVVDVEESASRLRDDLGEGIAEQEAPEGVRSEAEPFLSQEEIDEILKGVSDGYETNSSAPDRADLVHRGDHGKDGQGAGGPGVDSARDLCDVDSGATAEVRG